MLPPRDYRALALEQIDPIAALWQPPGKTLKTIKLLGDVENLVWQIEADKPFVLRMTLPDHRSRRALEAELSWIELLSQAGLPVVTPMRSQNDLLLEAVDALDASWSVSAFGLIQGRFLARDEMPPATTEALGELAAQLHIHGNILPKELSAARQDWLAHAVFPEVGDTLPASGQWVLELQHDLRTRIQALPRDDNYGLIHGDIHRGNFILANDRDDRPILFDFDDAHWGWYTQDLALILYSALPRESSDPAGFATPFLAGLRRGYERHRPWPADFDDHLSLFLRWRDLSLWFFIQARWPEAEQRPERASQSLSLIGQRLKMGKTIIEKGS